MHAFQFQAKATVVMEMVPWLTPLPGFLALVRMPCPPLGTLGLVFTEVSTILDLIYGHGSCQVRSALQNPKAKAEA